MAYVRTVKTASGARAVHIAHTRRRGSRTGSAHTDADLELLKAVARQRLAAGQGELDLLRRAARPMGAVRYRARPHAQRGAHGSPYTKKKQLSRVKIEGVYDGVNMRVIFEPATDRIITAFPIGR